MAGVFGPSRPSLQVRAAEESEGNVDGNSSGKEATVKRLPISKGIAGVSMRLEPGAIRARPDIGERRSRVLIGFNTGHYEAIDLSMWIAGNPPAFCHQFSSPGRSSPGSPRTRLHRPTEPRSQPECEVH